MMATPHHCVWYKNYITKCQFILDESLAEFSPKHIVAIPQLFRLFENEKLVLLLNNIVDDIMVCGTDRNLHCSAQNVYKRLKNLIFVHEPGSIRFFGISIVQNEDFLF